MDEATHQPLPQQSEMFFSLYFCMTGLHALHMVIGIGLLLWLVLKARRGRVHGALQHAGRHGRALLALRRHRLDLPLSAAVPAREAHAVSGHGSNSARGTAGSAPTSSSSRPLMVFTGLTVWAAYQHLGIWNTPVALAIATAKALLVALIFMHLRSLAEADGARRVDERRLPGVPDPHHALGLPLARLAADLRPISPSMRWSQVAPRWGFPWRSSAALAHGPGVADLRRRRRWRCFRWRAWIGLATEHAAHTARKLARRPAERDLRQRRGADHQRSSRCAGAWSTS